MNNTCMSDLDAVAAMQRMAAEAPGGALIDDDTVVLVGLAQRAILAGLASDFSPDMQQKFRESAEKHRAAHEESLGRKIKENF